MKATKSEFRCQQLPKNSTLPKNIWRWRRNPKEGDRTDTITNPVLIIEVWSKSTKGIDSSDKFIMYRQIPSVQEYVMIDQERVHVERYCRSNEIFGVLATFENLDDDLPRVYWFFYTTTYHL